MTDLTPMMRQYFEIKNQYPDMILFYRLGDFYEMFYEDAIIASKELDIALTGRNAGEGKKAPLCGVPYHSVETHLGTLIKKGYSVAICEQLEDPRKVKGLVKRGVVKIVTPGTLTEPSQLESSSNNYLLSVVIEGEEAAISFMDLSTFQVELISFQDKDVIKQVFQEVNSLKPSEVLSQREMGFSVISSETILSERYYDTKRTDIIEASLKTPSMLKTLSEVEKQAVFSLLYYVLETQMIEKPQFHLKVHMKDQYMGLDSIAVSNLELFETLRSKEKKGSLLGLLDKTKSALGARRLKEWIRKPLYRIEEIHHRLDLVELFLESDFERQNIMKSLSKISDIERIMAKLIFGSIQPKDIRSLENSLNEIPHINENLIDLGLDCLEDFSLLRDRMKLLFLEELPDTIKDGKFIQPRFNPELNEYHEILTHGGTILLAMEKKEREHTGIKNLKIKFNKVFGYFYEVTNSYKDLVPDHFIRKQTLAGSERYFTEELKELEDKMANAKEKRIELEKAIYQDFLDELRGYHEALLECAKTISELDVLTTFASLAREYNYTRPNLHEEGELVIKDGRHPVIEAMIGRDHFVTNDTLLNQSNHQFSIITGPNMAGKSTYLRQVALITLLAHMGSFVPASEAHIPLTDHIFTRVGASDDLASGQSTFLVEMAELAYILNQCTTKSLIILDEIGRGTSTYDGLSIAWATVEYLTKQVRPKTLFATHYHELTEIEDKIEHVKNYRIAVQRMGEDLVLLRKIVPGRAHQSYGIEAAKLAGLPDSLLNRAKEILTTLELNDNTKVKGEVTIQPNDVVKSLLDIPIDEITPLEAINLLSDLIKKAHHEQN